MMHAHSHATPAQQGLLLAANLVACRCRNALNCATFALACWVRSRMYRAHIISLLPKLHSSRMQAVAPAHSCATAHCSTMQFKELLGPWALACSVLMLAVAALVQMLLHADARQSDAHGCWTTTMWTTSANSICRTPTSDAHVLSSAAIFGTRSKATPLHGIWCTRSAPLPSPPPSPSATIHQLPPARQRKDAMLSLLHHLPLPLLLPHGLPVMPSCYHSS